MARSNVGWVLPTILPTLPWQSAPKIYVDQNAPGATLLTFGATVTPILSNGQSHIRISPSVSAAMAVTVPTGGIDTQKWVMEMTASGGQQVVTFATGYQLGGSVTSRSVTIPSGATALVYLVQLGTVSRLAGVDPGG